MLLFQSRFHTGLVSGEITLTFRLWPTSRVKPGSRYRCHPIGVLVVDAVDRVPVATISNLDAKRAGFPGKAALVEYLQGFSKTTLSESSEVFRVALHFGGEGDFSTESQDDKVTDEAFEQLTSKLARMDSSSQCGPWTRTTLDLIEQHPRTAASKLAAMVERDTRPFKADVVKLKKLGLTQSFEVGSDLTPRGRAFLDRLRKSE